MVHATAHTHASNPIADPRLYWRVTAFAVLAVAVLGLVWNMFAGNEEGIGSFLVFDWGHNVVHIVLAGAAFYFGFGNVTHGTTRTFAMVFGAVYLALGVLGFFVTDLAILHLELGENLVHLVLGAWGLLAGLLSK